MIEWSQKSRPKKIPRASSKPPQKIPGPKFNSNTNADFVALKSSRQFTKAKGNSSGGKAN